MIRIDVYNSYSRITGLSASEEKQLSNELSYVAGGKSSYFSKYGVKRRSLLSKKGEFPTGLLHRISVKVGSVVDHRVKPSISPAAALDGVSPYPWQAEAVEAAYEANRGIISAPTGTGKSLAMALLIAKYNLPTLVVVPSLEIKRQLKEAFLSYGLTNVYVHNIDATLPASAGGFDVLIIDEVHHAAAKTYQKANKTAWKDIYYRFFFTATPFRNDTEETLLFESIAGEVIYKLDYQSAIKVRYIVPVEAYYLEMEKQKTDAFTWAEVYKELVVNNTPRNVIIAKLLTQLHSSGKSTLCLVKEVRHGEILSELTGLPFVSGQDEESRKYIKQFNKSNIKVLIGTTGILGEGVDTKPCEYVVIAGLGKAKSQLMQQIGRSVRTYPGKESGKIILICDKSHKFPLRHFKEACKILKEEYGIKSLKVEI